MLSIFPDLFRLWDSILAPLGRLSGLICSALKNIKLFFYIVLLGGGHLRPLREKGGSETPGRHLGGSGRHLGGIWEASRRQGARGGWD